MEIEVRENPRVAHSYDVIVWFKDFPYGLSHHLLERRSYEVAVELANEIKDSLVFMKIKKRRV